MHRGQRHHRRAGGLDLAIGSEAAPANGGKGKAKAESQGGAASAKRAAPSQPRQGRGAPLEPAQKRGLQLAPRH